MRLARGERLKDILDSIDGVSEGVFTAIALEQLIKTKVRPSVFDFKFPIISGVSTLTSILNTFFYCNVSIMY